MTLTNKVAVVVGGARMGDALGRAFASRGADVAFTYRHSRDAADRAAAVVTAAGRRTHVVECDVTADVPAIEAVMQAIVDTLGRLDVLVLMASRYESVPYAELTTWAVERTLGVDMRGTFVCAQAAVPHMRASGGGRIITFGDWTAASGRPRYKHYAPYYIAKAGVKAITEVLALELAPDILVNSIAPGPVLPPDDMPDTERARAEAVTPVGRWGGAEAVAQAVITLAETDFLTGETIRLDGGRHLR